MTKITLENTNTLRMRTIPDGLSLFNPRDGQPEIAYMFYVLGSKLCVISSTHYNNFRDPTCWIVSSSKEKLETLGKLTEAYATYRNFSFTTDTKEIKRHMMMRELLQ